MDGARQAMYEFVTGILNLVTNGEGIWLIIGPFVLMLAVIRIILWARGSARGTTEAELLGEADRLRSDYRDRAQQLGSQARRLRDSGRRRP